MKKKEFILLLCLPTFLHLRSVEDETKSPSNLICNEKKNQIFYMLWKNKLDKYFYLTFKEKRSLLSSMTAKICFKM